MGATRRVFPESSKREAVERTLDRDHFMSADEARAWGLIDRIVGARQDG